MKKMLLVLVTFLSFSISAIAAVNLNTATQAELESLNNVGPVKAQAIIDYRKKSGGFKTVEELNNVPGIGDKTMQSLKGEISVSGVTKVTTPVAKDAKPVKDTKAAKTVAVKPAVADKVAVDVKPVDTAKADKKSAADAKQAAADKKVSDKKAAADAKKSAKADIAPATTPTKAK